MISVFLSYLFVENPIERIEPLDKKRTNYAQQSDGRVLKPLVPRKGILFPLFDHVLASFRSDHPHGIRQKQLFCLFVNNNPPIMAFMNR